MALVIIALGLAACGEEGAEASAPTVAAPADTVRVGLYSYGFEVEQDTFVAGRPYHFVIENEAEIPHEWVVVPGGATDEEAALIEVEEEEFPPGAVHAVTFNFPEVGTYDFACFMEAPADHYRAGMVYPVTVVDRGL